MAATFPGEDELTVVANEHKASHHLFTNNMTIRFGVEVHQPTLPLGPKDI